MKTELLSDTIPCPNMMVRYLSENPEREPVGSIIDAGYGAITIEWQDGHSPSNVPRDRWHLLEVV